jgi:membrane protease YdiL (CAAX protease family)
MIGRTAAAAGGMVLFALCAHQGGAWAAIAAGGLIVTAVAISGAGQRAEGKGQREGQRAKGRGQRFGASPLEGFGLGHFSIATLGFTLAGAGIGAGAGLWHRYGLGLPLLPSVSVQPFVIVACLVGAAEELLYRGWLLGQARRFGWPAAIVIAAVAHAAYKTALFAWPPAPMLIDLWWLLLVTTAGGLVLGALRAFSGSVVPAIVAHVAFDFVVYRAVSDAPWWVWG